MIAGLARFDALPSEERVDGRPVEAQDSADSNRFEASVVDQPADRLRMDAQLPGNLPDAVEAGGSDVDGSHDPSEACRAARRPA
jgi:hypothetical protein